MLLFATFEISFVLVLSDGVIRRQLFDVWRTEACSVKKIDSVFNFLSEHSDLDNYSVDTYVYIRKVLSNFCAQIQIKWIGSRRILAKFLSKNEKWLDGRVMFGKLPVHQQNLPSTSTGRPSKAFAKCSEQTKRRKVQHLLTSSHEELVFASRMSLVMEGKRDAANITKLVTSSSPERATKVKKIISSPYKLPVKMSGEKALALYIDNKFTKEQYNAIRQISKTHNADIYPSYKRLIQEKMKYYPEDIIITESMAEINLQSLVDHTIKRLVAVQYEVLKQAAETEISNLNIIFKWGCDGSSGHSQYKQVFEDAENDDFFYSLYLCFHYE